jgi:hypothetical protein
MTITDALVLLLAVLGVMVEETLARSTRSRT